MPKSEDGTTDGTIFEEWGKVSLEAGDAFNKTLRVVDEARANIINAGFEEVVERRFRCPIGPWAKDPYMKELGHFNRLQWEEGIEGWTMYLLINILGVRDPFLDSCFALDTDRGSSVSGHELK